KDIDQPLAPDTDHGSFFFCHTLTTLPVCSPIWKRYPDLLHSAEARRCFRYSRCRTTAGPDSYNLQSWPSPLSITDHPLLCLSLPAGLPELPPESKCR